MQVNWGTAVEGSYDYDRTEIFPQQLIYIYILLKIKHQRTKRKLELFFNIQNNSLSQYLRDQIPPTI